MAICPRENRHVKQSRASHTYDGKYDSNLIHTACHRGTCSALAQSYYASACIPGYIWLGDIFIDWAAAKSTWIAENVIPFEGRSYQPAPLGYSEGGNVIRFSLLQHHHFTSLYKSFCFQTIQIQTAGNFTTCIICSIPNNLMLTGTFLLVYQRYNLLSK